MGVCRVRKRCGQLQMAIKAKRQHASQLLTCILYDPVEPVTSSRDWDQQLEEIRNSYSRGTRLGQATSSYRSD